MADDEGLQADAGEEASRYSGALGVGGRTAHEQFPIVPWEQIEHRGAFGARSSDPAHTEHDHGEIPDGIRRYLIAGEEHAIATRYHPAMLTRHAAIFLGASAANALVNSWAYYHHQANPDTVHLIWLLWLGVAVWYAAHAVKYRYSWLVITPVRILTISGVVGRHVRALPMKRIRDVQLDRDLWGRWLGYGTIRTESLATDHALSEVRFVPDPDRVYGAIWGILLPKKGVSPMPDEVS